MTAPSFPHRSPVEIILGSPHLQVAAGTKTLAERKSWTRPAALLRASSALALGIGVGAWALFPQQLREQVQTLQTQVSKAWLSHPAFVEGRPIPGPNPALPVDLMDQWKDAVARAWNASPAHRCVPPDQRVPGDPVLRDEKGCPLVAPELSALRPLRPF